MTFGTDDDLFKLGESLRALCERHGKMKLLEELDLSGRQLSGLLLATRPPPTPTVRPTKAAAKPTPAVRPPAPAPKPALAVVKAAAQPKPPTPAAPGETPRQREDREFVQRTALEMKEKLIAAIRTLTQRLGAQRTAMLTRGRPAKEVIALAAMSVEHGFAPMPPRLENESATVAAAANGKFGAPSAPKMTPRPPRQKKGARR